MGYKTMIDAFKNWLRLGGTHEHVGRIFYSPYFKKPIVVTSYVSDSSWRFRFYQQEFSATFAANASFSYFLENGLERKDLLPDNMNKLKEYR